MNSESWKINPTTGDYVMENGSPVPDTGLEFNSYLRLKTQRGQWLYAPDRNYGSDIHLIKKNNTVRSSNAVETAASKALQPIVDDGRAAAISVNTAAAARHGLGLDIKVLDNAGNVEQFEFKGLGV